MRYDRVLLAIATAILADCPCGGGGVEPDPNNTPPTVTITAPTEGQQFNVYQPINFSGSATDPEDGNSTARLDWNLSYFLDLPVLIGRGGAFAYDNFPAVGEMTVEASAQDINGGRGKASVSFWVLVGGELAFDRNNETEIRRSDGRTNTLVDIGGNPAWSPDGKQIAFVRDVGVQAEIFIVDLTSNALSRVTTNAVDDYAPAWSPDGLRLAYVSQGPGNPDIFLITLATGATVNMTNNSANDGSPAWRGTNIAFESDRDGDFEIFVQGNILSAPPTQLTFNSVDDRNPHWTPTGRIVFSSGPPNLNGILQPHDIFIMDNFPGTLAQNLTNHAANDREPDMSPDGQKIAFVSDRSGEQRIWLMRTTSPARPVRVDNANINARHPRWRPPPP